MHAKQRCALSPRAGKPGLCAGGGGFPAGGPRPRITPAPPPPPPRPAGSTGRGPCRAPSGANTSGNDGAMPYLAMLTARLVATITEVVGDEARLDPDEDGETMLMPSVDVLACLCERYGAEPPRPDAVHEW